MPFRLIRLGKRSQQYNVSSKDLFVVPIELLDQSVIECTLLATSTGQECLLNISQRLGLLDSKYFGLLCLTRRDLFQWIDLEKPVKKQLERFSDSFRLYLRVQYYVPAADVIGDEVSRSHYYLQLKTQIVDERVRCSRDDAIRLASYSLQSEFGDYDPERHTLETLSNYALLPRSIAMLPRERDILLEQAILGFKALHGIQPTVAQVIYISEAQQLIGFGQEGFPARDPESGADMCLGVSLQGIFVLKAIGMDLYPWTDIANLIHQKKSYIVELNDGSRKNFLMVDGDMARFCWQVCVKQHQYFLKSSSGSNPKENGDNGIIDRYSNGQELLQQHQQQPEVNGNHHFVHAISTAAATVFHQPQQQPIEENGHNVHYEELTTYQAAKAAEPMVPNAPEVIPPALAAAATSAIAIPSNLALHEPLPSTHYETIKTVSDNQSIYSNITTVQVHHEPPWAAQPAQSEPLSIKTNLPAYQEPPSYEAFCKEKRTFQTPVGHATQTSLVPQYYLSMQKRLAQATQQSTEPIHNPGPRLSLPPTQPNGHFVMSPAPVTYHAMAHPFTNSSPDLHSVVNGMRTIYSPTQATVLKHHHHQSAPPMSYYTSVPDLSAQMQQRLMEGRSQLVRPATGGGGGDTMMAQLSNCIAQQQAVDAMAGKLAIGSSEPSIPNATYSLLHNNGHLGTPEAAAIFKAASRHLSIDTLNHIRNNFGHSFGDSPYTLLKRPLNGFTIRESAREHCPTQQPVNSRSVVRRRSHEENVYENIQELRAALQNELKQEQQQKQSEEAELHQKLPQEQFVTVAATVSQTPSRDTSKVAVIHHHGSVAIPAHSSTLSPEAKPSVSLAVNEKTPRSRTDTSASENLLNMSTASTASKDPRINALEAKLDDPDFMRDFELLPRMNPTAKFTTALLPENIARNRFRDILPYEDNRVKLPSTKDNRTGYINASHVTMTFGKLQQRYIAAQGPLAHTVVDFWQMIWSNNVNLIVMVTEFSEEGQEKCFTYYPQSSESEKSVLHFADFTVKCNFMIESNTYITSSLTLSHNDKSITVWHIRYTDWPDHTCPQDLQGFLSFLEGVDAIYRLSMREGSSMTLKKSKKKKDNQLDSPILIHCSAGVGRSGVVILCDALLRSLDTSKDVDVPKSLIQLRFQRMISVQNFGQYKFVYRVLALCLRNSRLI